MLSRASIAGAAVGFLLILTAILIGTNNLLGFFSMEGLMIVVGGSLAVAFMSFEANYVMEALRSIGLMFRRAETTHQNLQKDLIEIINWARIVKDRGLLGLENETGKGSITDPFVRYGIDMVVSNYPPEDVRSMMETAADASYERATIPSRVLMAMAGHAPAFGMVGTLVAANPSKIIISTNNDAFDKPHEAGNQAAEKIRRKLIALFHEDKVTIRLPKEGNDWNSTTEAERLAFKAEVEG